MCIRAPFSKDVRRKQFQGAPLIFTIAAPILCATRLNLFVAHATPHTRAHARNWASSARDFSKFSQQFSNNDTEFDSERGL